ncbi:MAG: hypothetical protein A2812_01660 [Candidatus Staskawiczbacteria bacterium RIFCSPHIGHO2_01_FULL_36_16]|uniref:Undecaprenyl-diphosphatase n=1 Tax=Candidatus Staskawiczbacteria bacterium RIFCSPHIGHO2_01_FULL_36_16 TaxID=1802200 RepID=A0A1G2HSV4_9BACT|nr:MAG: hypothetical protein A2812_01660 [Candidatus Staskawiczbacteria bacterium RIFCSPHIGHO2_01_FULL_36_16]
MQSIILGAVQGLTEFLPVSSSGHLALFQHFFSFSTPPIFFDTIAHLGTLLAVVFYLKKEIIHIFKTLKEKQTIKLVLLIIIASLPAVIAGLLLKDKMEGIFSSLYLVGVSFIITSVILFCTKFFKSDKKDISRLNWFDALFIGVFQAFAILPGISRSGSTISASIFRSLKREDAFKFSFLMSIPVIFGAFLLQFTEQNFNLFNGGMLTNLTGFLFSAVFGFLSLKIIERVLIKGKLHYFAAYCFVLGVLILIFM